MVVHRLRELVGEDFESVNNLIIEKIQSGIALVDDLASYIVQSGGKRLRPLVVLLSCRACGYQGDNHIKLAAMIELFHTATLLHDDVIDESTLRRGQETAHEIWGSKASILVGDYLFIQYMQLLINVGDLNIIQLLTDISHQISCGEIKQLVNRHNPALTEEEYYEVIRAKTSLLFSASATLGALLSDSNEAVFNALQDYGLHLGNAFQLIDDALDYCSDTSTLGKNIGDDLADGKATLPLLHVLKYGTQEQQNKVKESLTRGTLDHLPDILSAIESTKAIEYTKGIAREEIDKALSALQVIPESVYKDALTELAHYAVERDH